MKHNIPFLPKRGRRTAALLAAVCSLALLCACASKAEQNLFQYAVSTEGSALSPKRAAFGASVSEVLEANEISQDSVDDSSGEPIILNTVSIPGVSDSVQEMFYFDDDKLVAVKYAVTAAEADFAALCQTLTDQAAAMPADLLQSELDLTGEQEATWEDAQGSAVRVTFPLSANDGEKIVMLEIHRGREAG